MILREISVKEIPYNHSNYEEDGKLVRIPLLKTNQRLSPQHIISTNYYLQIAVYMIYFSDIREYPIIINLPNSLNVDEIPFLPLIQTLTNLFQLQRAIIKNNSTVSQIFVKGLLPNTVEAVKELDRLNKIDPFVKKLFHLNRPAVNKLKPVRAYIIYKTNNLRKVYKLSNIQKYLIWECLKNNGVYGLPIGPLAINDLGQNDFQEFIQAFETTYIIGSGKPWVATHLIVSNIDRIC